MMKSLSRYAFYLCYKYAFVLLCVVAFVAGVVGDYKQLMASVVIAPFWAYFWSEIQKEMTPTVTRRGVFETNSSSTHSIHIVPGDVVGNLPVSDGICYVHAGEFGWEQETYTDAATKASYCLTSVMRNDPPDEDRLEQLRRVIEKVMGVPVQFCDLPDGWGGSGRNWGYIDHQSQDVPYDAFVSDETLENFIFNPSSYLVTDNDNH